MIQATSSSAIGVAARRAAVRQRSRRAFRRIMRFGQLPVILLAISWVYGSRCLIPAATQQPHGLLLTQGFRGSRWSWPIVSPVIRVAVRHRHRLLLSLVEVEAIVHGIILAAPLAVVQRTLRATFRRPAPLAVVIRGAASPRSATLPPR